ncbi:sodium/potassium/calcium exchanger 1-like [Argopecten irradians]|uniref:sodium/potassium/calcium exchanger 1-like n=1 Tax=Argopecten irradians TaxID=31199 RepID=UPI00371ADB07
MFKRVLYARHGANLKTLNWRDVEDLQDFPHMALVIELLHCLPPTSVSCETTFSQMKLIKTSRRISMSNDTLNDLLLVKLQSPSIAEFNPKDSIDDWLLSSVMPRRPHYNRTTRKRQKQTLIDQETVIEEEADLESTGTVLASIDENPTDLVEEDRIQEEAETPGTKEGETGIERKEASEIEGKEKGEIEGKEKSEIEGKIQKEGEIEGKKEDETEGKKEGEIEGKKEGEIEGKKEDETEGKKEGEIEGKKEGEIEGKKEDETEGKKEGEIEGKKGGEMREERDERGEERGGEAEIVLVRGVEEVEESMLSQSQSLVNEGERSGEEEESMLEIEEEQLMRLDFIFGKDADEFDFSEDYQDEEQNFENVMMFSRSC